MLLVIVVLVAALAFGTAMARTQRGLPLIARPIRQDKWWATLLLPLLAILLSLPAGENPTYDGDFPWVGFIYVYLLPIWIGLVAVGVGAHKLADHLPFDRGEPRSA